MPSKKPDPTFEALFEAPDIYPERIPLRHLSRTLSALQRLVAGHAAMSDAEEQVADGSLGLLGVKRGSAIFQFAGESPKLALAYLRETGKVLEHPEDIGDNDYILNPVEELSAVARSLRCSIILREPGKGSEILARIEPTSYSSIAGTLIVEGDTALTGKVLRVGGATETRCGLRVASQARMLFCKVPSADVARKLGERLYKEVAVYGKAQWIKTNWRVIGFTIMDVHQPRLGTVSETIEALREAGGKDWDDIDDPEAFLEEVSGER